VISPSNKRELSIRQIEGQVTRLIQTSIWIIIERVRNELFSGQFGTMQIAWVADKFYKLG